METTSLISARLPNAVIARLVEDAARDGVPFGTYVRRIIEGRYGLEKVDGRRRTQKGRCV